MFHCLGIGLKQMFIKQIKRETNKQTKKQILNRANTKSQIQNAQHIVIILFHMIQFHVIA